MRKPPKETAIDYLTDLVRDVGAEEKDRLKAAEILIKTAPVELSDNKIEVNIRIAE